MSQTILDDSLKSGENFDKAAFRLWIGEPAKPVRGVLVMVPGSNGDGRNLVMDTAWQNLARKHELALLGCYFTDRKHENMAIDLYADVKKGSGDALEIVLKKFSVTGNHPEIANAPLALWGMSAGGQFNYEFACWKPERIIAFVVNKGGIYYSSLAPAAAWEVPGIFFTGQLDMPFRNNIIIGIFSINRRFGAKWILAEEPGTAHEFTQSAIFARKYFDKIIPLRLPDPSEPGSMELKKLPSSGFIGIRETGEIKPYPGTGPIPQISSWFPDEEMAAAWGNIKNNQVKKSALLLVDIQDFYFPGDGPGLVGAEEASVAAADILKVFRDNSQLVVHVRHQADKGFEIRKNVAPLPAEKVFTKKDVNSFKDTGLLEYLRANKITHLVIAGMQTHMCLEAAVRAASDYGFECLVVPDACATRDLTFDGTTATAASVQASTLATLKGGGYARVVSLQEFLQKPDLR